MYIQNILIMLKCQRQIYMIDQPWPALTFLLILEIALIGAFWKLSNHIDKIQNEYSEKIPMIEAIIRSTGTLPVIIKLIGFIEVVG